MQADISINHCIAERLVSGVCVHCGLSPVVGEVQSLTKKDTKRKIIARKGKSVIESMALIRVQNSPTITTPMNKLVIILNIQNSRWWKIKMRTWNDFRWMKTVRTGIYINLQFNCHPRNTATIIWWAALTDFPRIPGRMRRRVTASTRKTRIMVSKRPLKMKEILCSG